MCVLNRLTDYLHYAMLPKLTQTTFYEGEVESLGGFSPDVFLNLFLLQLDGVYPLLLLRRQPWDYPRSLFEEQLTLRQQQPKFGCFFSTQPNYCIKEAKPFISRWALIKKDLFMEPLTLITCTEALRQKHCKFPCNGHCLHQKERLGICNEICQNVF